MFVVNLKALIVVLTLALFVFALAKPLCLRFMTLELFVFRRNLWLGLTVVGFLSPNLLVHLVLTSGALIWASRREPNPVALFVLLLHVVPPYAISLASLGLDKLIVMTHYRLLSAMLLLPVAIRLYRSADASTPGSLRLIDVFLLSYGALQIAQLVPYESFTASLRRMLMFTLDVWLPYYVISRFLREPRQMTEAMAMFCLACAIHVPISVFEALRHWILYAGIGSIWGAAQMSYIFRGDALRAQSSVGHPLGFGFLMAMGFAFWLHVRTRLGPPSAVWRLGAVWMWFGLIAAYSRSPWLVAVLAFFAYLLLGKNGVSRVMGALVVSVVVGGLVMLTPWGDKIVAALPFVGSVDEDTVDYRKQLAEASWRLIQLNPVFGNPLVLQDMEDIRAIQGEGIVDLVNTFAAVALFNGVVGLFLFLGPIAMGLKRTFFAMRRPGLSDEAASLGAVLLACTLGTLLMMATGSFGTSLAIITWMLVGMMAAYSRMPAEAQAPVAPVQPRAYVRPPRPPLRSRYSG